MKKVIVVTGVCGTALAIAKRIGPGYQWVLADLFPENLSCTARSLCAAGYEVSVAGIDVTKQESVENLVRMATGLGELHALVHTTGLSLTTANPGRILQVNLTGTIRLLEAFEPYITLGTIAFVVGPSEGLVRENKKLVERLAVLKSDALASFISSLDIREPAVAYNLSKQGNLRQVQGAAARWEQKGARIFSISPKVSSATVQSAVQYVGQRKTPEAIAPVIEFLQDSPDQFVSGFDVQVEEGMTIYTNLRRLV